MLPSFKAWCLIFSSVSRGICTRALTKVTALELTTSCRLLFLDTAWLLQNFLRPHWAANFTIFSKRQVVNDSCWLKSVKVGWFLDGGDYHGGGAKTEKNFLSHTHCSFTLAPFLAAAVNNSSNEFEIPNSIIVFRAFSTPPSYWS